MSRLLRFSLVLALVFAALGLASPPAAEAAPVVVELITNGGFESGWTGWSLYNNGSGGTVLNDGTFAPPAFGPLPPISGSWDAVTWQGGPGIHRMAQMVGVPGVVTSATLQWKDRLRNSAPFLDPVCPFDYFAGCSVQDWKVGIYDASWNLVQEVYSTNPSDPPMQVGPNVRSVDVSALLQGLAGQNVWVAFIEVDNQGYFSAALDDVSLQVVYQLPVAKVANAAAREDAGTLTLTASLDVASGVPVSVDWVTVDNTAVSPADYTASGGTVTFPPGSTSQPIVVPIADDNVDEPNERFWVQLSNPVNCTIAGKGKATGTIRDNDATPQMSIIGATGWEHVGTLMFPVVLDRPSSRTVTVNYATQDWRAFAPGDYTATSGVLSFPPGSTREYISVVVVDDGVWEGVENFRVKLSAPVFATLRPLGIGVGTIIDNDTAL